MSAANALALADVFADDSENDGTFYGFSDSEIDHGVSDLPQITNHLDYCQQIGRNIMLSTVTWSLLLK